MAGTQWYYAVGKTRMGPVSSSDLRRLVQEKRLKPDNLIWKEGMSEWVPASRVKGLFSSEESTPQRPAAPQQRKNPEEKNAVSRNSLPSEAKASQKPRPLPETDDDLLANFDSSSAASSDEDDDEETFERRPKPVKKKKKRKRAGERLSHTATGPDDDAGAMRRIGGMLLDLVIRIVSCSVLSGIVGFVLTMLIGLVAMMGFQVVPRLPGLTFMILMVYGPFALIFLAYDVVFETSRMQGPPGKYLLGIKVGDLYGNRISWGASFVRTLVKFGLLVGLPALIYFMPGLSKGVVRAIISIIAMIGMSSLNATQRKRSFHDLIAGTYVLWR